MTTKTTSTTNNAGPSPAPREAHQRTGEEDRNLEMILVYAEGGKRYLSTTQAFMVGLALCRPDLLGGCSALDAWRRLDDEQLAAIGAFVNTPAFDRYCAARAS